MPMDSTQQAQGTSSKTPIWHECDNKAEWSIRLKIASKIVMEIEINDWNSSKKFITVLPTFSF